MNLFPTINHESIENKAHESELFLDIFNSIKLDLEDIYSKRSIDSNLIQKAREIQCEIDRIEKEVKKISDENSDPYYKSGYEQLAFEKIINKVNDLIDEARPENKAVLTYIVNKIDLYFRRIFDYRTRIKPFINACENLTFKEKNHQKSYRTELKYLLDNLRVISSSIQEDVDILPRDLLELVYNYAKSLLRVNLLISDHSKKTKEYSQDIKSYSYLIINLLQEHFLSLKSDLDSFMSILEIFNINKKGKTNDTIHIFQGIEWTEYIQLLERIGDVSWCRISYLDGVLELMCPGKRHENINRNIDLLIIAYCDYKEIDYIVMGSTTYKTEISKSGKEPDSSYMFGEPKEVADLAIEINFSSGNIEDLEKFKNLNIKEVWIWNKNDDLKMYYLENSEYKIINLSIFVEGIKPEIIKKYVLLMNKNESKTRIYKKRFISEVTSNTPESSS